MCAGSQETCADLQERIANVRDSDVLVLFQSEEVLTRPSCLLELYAAATAGVPIVSLTCSGKGYNIAAAEDHLLHLDMSLPATNPAAIRVLEANGIPVLRIAQVLWTTVPHTINVPLNSMGSENAIRAAVFDLVKAMQRARAFAVPSDELAGWLDDREARDEAALLKALRSSTTRGVLLRERVLRKIERTDELACEVSELKAELAVHRGSLNSISPLGREP